MRTDLYPKIAPLMKLLALGLSVPARSWWLGLAVIGAMTLFGGTSWGRAIYLTFMWGLTVMGSVAALSILATIENRWRAEWDGGGRWRSN